MQFERAAYGASKAALQCSTKSLSREVGEIIEQICAPGITKTDMISSMMDEVIELGQSTSCKDVVIR